MALNLVYFGGLFHLRNVRRVLSTVFVSMLSIGLTGCGFVDVHSLTANTQRTSVVVVGTSTILSNAQIASVMGQARHGITAVSITESAKNVRLQQDVQAAHAKMVVFLDPTAAEQALAKVYPTTHFVWIGYSGINQPPANVTWVIPNVSLLASSAGYMAGGIHGYGKPVGIMVGNVPSLVPNGDIVSAVSSGMHIAYSSAIPIFFTGSTKQQVAMLTSNPVRDFIVVGSLTSTVKAAVQAFGVPVVDVNLGAITGGFPTEIGQVDARSFLASGLAQVLVTLERGQSLPEVLQANAGQFTNLAYFPGWQSPASILAYQHLLSSGKIAPTQFANTAPSVQTTLALSLPVPTALMPASSPANGAGATTPSKSTNQGTSVGTAPSTSTSKVSKQSSGTPKTIGSLKSSGTPKG